MPGKPGWCLVNGGEVPENFNTVAIRLALGVFVKNGS